MSSPFMQLNIIPDTEIINTFKTDARITIASDTYTLSGTVEVILTRPLQIRQLYVQFQGQIDCLISTADFYRAHEPSESSSQRDEIPLHKWNTIDTNEIGLINKITRKALGQSNAGLTIIDKRVIILDKSQELEAGKTCWPFSIKINNIHLLPPSILLPHQLIQYNLSAKIKLNSLGERVKLTYWSVRMNTLRIKSGNNGGGRIANSTSFNSTLPPLSPTDTITTTATTAITPSSSTPSNIVPQFHQTIYSNSSSNINNYTADDSSEEIISNHNNTDLISATVLKSNNSNNKRQLLDVNKIIQICRHSYPNINSVYSIARIRYRGSRRDRINYEISMSKFTCIQKKNYTFICRFNSLCEDTKIDSVDYYLEQNELYPVRAGDYNTMSKILPDAMVPRHRKFSRTKHNMQCYENENDLELSISLDMPQISPAIDTHILKISHKLRLILRFVDSKRERDMSLSFPLSVGTVPIGTTTNSAANSTAAFMDNIIVFPEVEEEHSSNYQAVHVRQELDQWLLAPGQHHHHPQTLLYSDKLPTYIDALNEGNPPSPFTEDVIHRVV